jgi:hypothetical protein
VTGAHSVNCVGRRERPTGMREVGWGVDLHEGLASYGRRIMYTIIPLAQEATTY